MIKPLDKLKNLCYNIITVKSNSKLKKKGKVLIMTNRAFFTAIVNGEMNDKIVAKATEEIAKLDARNAKRSATPSKKSLENEPIKAKIVEFLASGSHLASEIASGCEISTSKASALCRQLVESGSLTVCDVKVKGKGTQKSYSLA